MGESLAISMIVDEEKEEQEKQIKHLYRENCDLQNSQ